MSVTTRTNLATNPRPGAAATNWSVVAGTGGTAALAWNSGAGADGKAGFVRTTWSVATTVVSGGASYLQTGLSAATQNTHSLWVKSSRANQVIALSAQYQNSSSVNVGSATAGANVTLTTAGTWYQISVTATSGAAVDRVVLTAQAVSGANWAASDTFDASLLLIEAAATVGGYIDGALVAGLGVSYAWTGAANASTSTATAYAPVLTLTPLTAPTDSVQVQITDLQPLTNFVTVWRTADGVRRALRVYRKVSIVGSDSVVDSEVPLGRAVTYDLEVYSGPGVGSPTATAVITVNATSGWIQDPLDPNSAIRLQSVDGTTGPTLTMDALKQLDMAVSGNLIEIIGSREPVALLGQRMLQSKVPFSMITNAAQQATNLRNLIMQTGLLLIRPLPAWSGALPGLCYTAAPTPVELPKNEAWGGTLIEWKFETPLVAAPTMNLAIALFAYQDWQALWTTYQQAQTTLTGATYLGVKQRPATG